MPASPVRVVAGDIDAKPLVCEGKARLSDRHLLTDDDREWLVQYEARDVLRSLPYRYDMVCGQQETASRKARQGCRRWGASYKVLPVRTLCASVTGISQGSDVLIEPDGFVKGRRSLGLSA